MRRGAVFDFGCERRHKTRLASLVAGDDREAEAALYFSITRHAGVMCGACPAKAPRRRRDAREVEGARGVCYSIWLGAWRSLVAHLPWEQGVGRSNRLAPTSRQ